MRKIVIGLTLILFMLSCKKHYKHDSKLTYDIQLEYMSTPLGDNTELPNDSVIICFTGNFNNDTIDVYVNHKFYKTSILTTDQVVGVAGELVLPNYEMVENIGIRINKGKLIFVEPERKHFNIMFDFVDDKVSLRFYRKLPNSM